MSTWKIDFIENNPRKTFLFFSVVAFALYFITKFFAGCENYLNISNTPRYNVVDLLIDLLSDYNRRTDDKGLVEFIYYLKDKL